MKKIATEPALQSKKRRQRGMSFRIYRLAKKEEEQGGPEGVFAQIITRPDGQGGLKLD
jgi:hypothetical protein